MNHARVMRLERLEHQLSKYVSKPSPEIVRAYLAGKLTLTEVIDSMKKY